MPLCVIGLILIIMLTCYGFWYVTKNLFGGLKAYYDNDQAWKRRFDNLKDK